MIFKLEDIPTVTSEGMIFFGKASVIRYPAIPVTRLGRTSIILDEEYIFLLRDRKQLKHLHFFLS